MSRRTIVSIIVVSLLPCAAARASDQVYTFRQNYRDGQQFNVLFSQNMELTYRGTYNGNVIGTFRHVDAMQNKGLLSVLKTSDGLPVSERIELDPASGEFTQSSGEAPKQTYTRLAGKAVTVTRDPTGAVSVDVDGDNSPRLAAELQSWLDRDEDLYPDHPVRVKEKWDLSKKMAKIMKLGSGMEVQAFCKLNSVKTVKGRQFAELHVSCGMVGHDRTTHSLNLELQMEGAAWVDLGTGRVAKLDLSGEVNVSGVVEVRTPQGWVVPVTASGDGKVDYHQLVVAAKQHPDTITAEAK